MAANLAARGFRVLLIEAGSDPESFNYQVPVFHGFASEEKDMSWNFYVHHYDADEQRAPKFCKDENGVLYPRAGTLGGCTAHNAMITVVPHDSDWNAIAESTSDDSWRADNMWKYFQRVERCQYRERPPAGAHDASGHGYDGWLGTSMVSPRIALGDREVVRTVFATMRSIVRHWSVLRWMRTKDDPNDRRNRAQVEGFATVPLATVKGKRNGAREFIRAVQKQHPDRLMVKLNHLATRVLFDENKRAVGVECREGRNLYRADPNAATPPVYEKREYRCTREVILAGGAFNTPQLLMLSGIGPKQHLEEMGIPCLADRPGVGSHLQDRYEVAVVTQMKHPFSMLRGATFKPPEPGARPDKQWREWEHGRGLYTSNGAMAALILKSVPSKTDPDLFIFSLPGDFHGYYPGYSKTIEERRDHLTWAIVKAHTENTGGTVRLRSSNPLERPEIRFHYFSEGTDKEGRDLDAVVTGVKLVRKMNAGNHSIARELIPGPDYPDDRLHEWVSDNAWGHHASCSCKMGLPTDDTAVVDSRFRVIGTTALRIVDASIFPRIPGFFIAMPIYMISEKAADVIGEDG
ncbi:MAG: GMC family oxidoreductase N-terminal domain-containing protein [Acidobacteriota bacterium]|nr:GMC family oxidoreductase N-terminal domain-containing protein [Acidobacteriota bacterium]